MFNAFSGPNSLKIALTTGSGEITSCSKNDFETDDLSFMDVSNRSSVSPGRYTICILGMHEAFHFVCICYVSTVITISFMLTMKVLLTLQMT